MAEEAETGEKRRRSTRNRTESAIKRQAVGDDSSKPKEVAKSTPTRQPPKSTPTSKASEKTKTKIKKAHVAPIVIEDAPLERVDVLPSKLVEGKPFPTLRELPKEYGSDYQSVKER